MPDDPYSLTDLARLADVTPRTIRYYVAQGLLPSPGSAGPATRYGDGHLARLRLIRRLQRGHLPLAEIRVRLERMRDEDVQAALEAAGGTTPEPDRSPGETLAYVRALMANAGVVPRRPDRPAGDAPPEPAPGMSAARPAALPVRPIPGAAALQGIRAPGSVPPLRRLYMDRPAAAATADDAGGGDGVEADPSAAPAAGTSRSVSGDRSTWERLVIVPDVEIHVRRPLGRLDNKRVDQLARIARELFDEEP